MMVSRRKDAPARRVTAVLAAGVAAALAWAAPQASASGGAAVRASGATANAIVAPGGLYEIVAIQGTPTGAKCVDVINGSTAPGARLQIFHCHGSDRNGAVQLFSFIDMGNGFYQVSNKNSHLCFELPNSSGADGTEIEQADCLGFGGQQWEIRSAAPPCRAGRGSGRCRRGPARRGWPAPAARPGARRRHHPGRDGCRRGG